MFSKEYISLLFLVMFPQRCIMEDNFCIEGSTLRETNFCDFRDPLRDCDINFIPLQRPDQVCTREVIHSPYPYLLLISSVSNKHRLADRLY